jgi:3-isopropylmalate/(R)-2-methylmalate dehydratase large subunit
VCVSTSNRNYTGRMGDPTASVFLSNPAVAMAAAVAGEIVHPHDVCAEPLPAAVERSREFVGG